MKKKTLQTKVGIVALTAGVLLGGVFFAFVYAQAFAFNGPSQAPSGGSGAIGSDSSNNVSVGTSTTISGTKLEVVGAGSNDTGSYAAQFFQNNKTPIFILRDDGSVSIETSTISAGNTVIGGNLTVGGTFTANGLTGTISSGNVSSGQFGSNTGGGNYSFPGSVGIGTTAPSGLLSLVQPSSDPGISLQNGSDSRFWVNTVGSELLVGGSGASQPTSGGIAITNGGNVGIGTTAPTYQLTLGGTGAVFGVNNTAVFNAENSSGTYESYFWPRWSDNVMYMNYGSGGFNIRNDSSVSTMFMTNGGSVGIGTTGPNTKLDVSGEILAKEGLPGACPGAGGYSFEGDGCYDTGMFSNSDGDLRFYSNDADDLNVEGSNIGIGTTSPGYKLDVEGGQINSSGGYCINGANCITSWPTGNAGTVTSITAGSGLSGGTITGSGTISLNTGNANTWSAAQTFTSNIVPGTVSNSGGSTWSLGPGAWSGNGPAVTNTDAVTGMTYGSGSGSQLFTLSSSPGQASFQLDGSIFVGDQSSPYNPLSISGSSDGYLLVDNSASIGGNLYVSGTISGSYSGTVSAGNVSSGQFGSNTGGGNYSFPGSVGIGTTAPSGLLSLVQPSSDPGISLQNGSDSRFWVNTVGSELLVGGSGASQPTSGGIAITNGGNVGIGTTSPGYTLTVNGAISVGGGGTTGSIIGPSMSGGYTYAAQNFNTLTNVYQTLFVNPSGSTNGPSGFSSGSFGNGYYFGMGGGDVNYRGFQMLGTGGSYLFFRSTEGSSFGGSAPWMEVAATNLTTNVATLPGSLSIGSSAYSSGDAGDISVSRNVAPTTGVIYLGSGGSHSLYFDGTNYNLPSGGLTLGGNLNMGSNKLTVGTIDPVYSIDGTNYATYGAAMTGVNEETDGTLTLARGAGGTYSTTIDFGAQATGSDLWLFAHATELTSNDNLANLVVILTPSFDGNVWYKKDAAAGTLTIYGNQAGEVSYRFTAPRFDASQWSNVAPAAETASFKL